MKHRNKKSRGFSLVELLVAMALGLLVLSATTTLFKKAMDLSLTLSQRAEMQQNARAAVNAMVRDLTLAGTDLPGGGIELPQSAAPLQPRFGCSSSSTCYLTNGANVFASNTFYYVNPHTKDGALIGPTPTVGGPPSPPGTIIPDSLVVAYADPQMQLGVITFPAGDVTGGTIIVSTPPGNIASQANGITPGDLIWLTSINGNSNPVNAIGVVTQFDGVSTINFAAGDALQINQPPTQTTAGGPITGNVAGNITSNLETTPPTNPPVIQGSVAPCVPSALQSCITAQRIFLVTYYVFQYPTTGRRVLRRQVNAHPPTDVAENVENLQVTYDTIDNTVNPPVPVINQSSPASSPNLIRKVNLALTVRTTQAVGANGEFQRLTLATAVSPRNLSTTAVF